MRSQVHSQVHDDIIKYYKEKGWVNQFDIDYYKFTDEEIAALSGWRILTERKYDIVRMVAFKKYGRMPKIGLTPLMSPSLKK